MPEVRLQKLMAEAGVGSRRACEQLIVDGRVQVGGHTVTELGTKADPDLVIITVDGRPLRFHERHVYVKVNKPRGVLSDFGGDTGGRRTVMDLVSLPGRRVFPVGRLDLNSEGLVLLTDDGSLAHRLTHPRFQHEKTYYVLLPEQPTAEALNALRQGIDLDSGRTAPSDVRVAERLPSDLRLGPGPSKGVWLKVGLREGKKRQLRHMTARVGYPTLRLVRWSISSLELGPLSPGESAYLTRKEVSQLRQALYADRNARSRPLARKERNSRPGRRNSRSSRGRT
jgi:23S rRNA pseudouridine2605 synthase